MSSTIPSPFEIGEGTSANANRDGSISIYQANNIIHMKPDEAQKFKAWLRGMS